MYVLTIDRVHHGIQIHIFVPSTALPLYRILDHTVVNAATHKQVPAICGYLNLVNV